MSFLRWAAPAGESSALLRFPVLFPRYFRKLRKSVYNGRIAASFVRKEAPAAVFDPFFGVGVAAAAALSQGIKRAITEQAVKILRSVGGVARKILAFRMVYFLDQLFFLLYFYSAVSSLLLFTFLTMFWHMHYGFCNATLYAINC